MKKLLSLLSILTISGTAIPPTIAAGPYQKEKQLNSDINYLQTINLETLNRNKRDNSNNFKLSKTLSINYDVKNYFKELCLILNKLVKKGVILPINDEKNAPISCNINYFVLNRNTSFNYFIIPI